MNDTPRTDALTFDVVTIRGDAHLAREHYNDGCGDSVDAEFARTLERELNAANAIIRQQQLLEEELIDAKGQYAALVADVVLYEDRGERIKRLEQTLESVTDKLDNAWGIYMQFKEPKP